MAGLLEFVPLIGTLLDRVLPDPKVAADAKLEMLRLAQTGELAELTSNTQLAQGQLDVNKVEAANQNLFVSGWRPFVGWTCGLAFFAKYMGGPFMFVIAQFFGKTIVLPVIDMTDMMPILFGMLGLGAMKSFERVRGVANPGK